MSVKKKTYGQKAKPRTRAEIENEYNQHGVQAGHKLRLMQDLQEEVDLHTEKMRSLHTEASKLPPPVANPNVAPAMAMKTETAGG